MQKAESRRKRMTAVSILLAIVMIFSLVMSISAWHDFTQSYTNAFRGTVARTKGDVPCVRKMKER